MTLNEWLKIALEKGFAIGHFNVSNLEGMAAVIRGAQTVGAPLIIGLSEGERKFFGIKQAVAAVRIWKEETGLPIFLNADHTKSFEGIKEAVDAGFDSVHFDGSQLDYETNIKETKRAVEYAKAKNPEISVEGELGYLRGESRLQEAIEIKPEDMTDPDRAAEFVRLTGVDRLAIVFGNIHGIVTKQKERLDLSRLEAIRAKTNAYLVLHGASGLSDDDVREAIKRGIVKVHINTELRVTFRKALEQALYAMPDETTPYIYLSPALEAMQKVVEEKLRLFGVKI
jgi:fructose-bisphosphate aldolase class II